jgi:hypothetical protein
MSIPAAASAIIAAMQAGATLYQEGDHTWYLAGANHPRESVDADACEWLATRDRILEHGADESPSGWKRSYILGPTVHGAW